MQVFTDHLQVELLRCETFWDDSFAVVATATAHNDKALKLHQDHLWSPVPLLSAETICSCLIVLMVTYSVILYRQNWLQETCRRFLCSSDVAGSHHTQGMIPSHPGVSVTFCSGLPMGSHIAVVWQIIKLIIHSGLCGTDVWTLMEIVDSADGALLQRVLYNPNHVLHSLLPALSVSGHYRCHDWVLPPTDWNLAD